MNTGNLLGYTAHKMNILEQIKLLIKNKKNDAKFNISPDSYGLNIFTDKNIYNKLATSKDNNLINYQFVYLQILQEEGIAHPLPNGFRINTEHSVRLDEEFRELFHLSNNFKGRFSLIVDGETFKNSFSIKVIPIRDDGREIYNFKLKGGILQITPEEFYLLDEPKLSAFMPFRYH